MERIFNNPNNISLRVVQRRLSELDPDGVYSVYSTPLPEVEGQPAAEVHYVKVDSNILTDQQVESALAGNTTASEQTYLNEILSDRVSLKTDIQNAIDTLTLHESFTSPTNTQVVNAVKFHARVLKLMIKLVARVVFHI